MTSTNTSSGYRLTFVYDQTQPVYSDPYTVTFNGNGGEPQIPSIEGNGITLPTATRENYTFMGWYDAAEGGNMIGAAGARYYPTSDITLYAHWQINTYTITLSKEGQGTISPATIDQQPHGTSYAIQNEILTIGNQQITATAEEGWKATWYLNGQPITAGGTITENTEFRCVFTITTYDVTISALTGGNVFVNGDSSVKKITDIPYGTPIVDLGDGTLTIDGKDETYLIIPSASTGYMFSKWTMTGSAVTKNTTITAVFTEKTDEKYTVVLSVANGVGGTIEEVNGNGQLQIIVSQVQKNSTIAINSNIITLYGAGESGRSFKAIADTGYTFNNWDGTEKTVLGDMTIYVHFQKDEEKVLVNFEAKQGGQISIDNGYAVRSNESLEVVKGSVVTLDEYKLIVAGHTVSANAIERYTFDYWADPNGVKITTGYVINGNTTLTAHFKMTDITIYPKTNTGGVIQIEGGQAEKSYVIPTDAVVTVDGITIKIGDLTFKAVANEGYHLAKWHDKDGKEFTTGMKLTADTDLFAQFEVDTPGPEPEPEKNDKNIGFMIGMIAGGVIAVVLAGLAIYGIRSPIVFVLMAVAVIVAVAMALLYFGAIKL